MLLENLYQPQGLRQDKVNWNLLVKLICWHHWRGTCIDMDGYNSRGESSNRSYINVIEPSYITKYCHTHVTGFCPYRRVINLQKLTPEVYPFRAWVITSVMSSRSVKRPEDHEYRNVNSHNGLQSAQVGAGFRRRMVTDPLLWVRISFGLSSLANNYNSDRKLSPPPWIKYPAARGSIHVLCGRRHAMRRLRHNF